MMLCSKLLNSCIPDTIDERALNLPCGDGTELPSKEALQNSNLCTHAASALGCSVSAISAQNILDGKVCIAPVMKILRLLQGVHGVRYSVQTAKGNDE